MATSEAASTTGAIAEKVLGDVSATMATIMAALGDRLGLFKALAASGQTTASDLAGRAGVDERYLREWLGGMAAAGYIAHDPSSGRFSLPVEHQPVLAQEAGPFFVGGAYQLLLAEVAQLDSVERAFRAGGGVPQAAFGDALLEGQERFSASWAGNLLTQVWVPLVPGLEAALQSGAAVADVGCGAGIALIRLAEAYPESYYVGYDASEPAIERAGRNARAAGVDDRVRFQLLDVAGRLPDEYDVITTFDVVHDAADPLALVTAIRRALRANGVYVCLEMNCADRPEQNTGPIATLFHGVSVLYCLTTSLAQGGAGLGTLGLPEGRLRALCLEAGFQRVRCLSDDNPFNKLYEIRP
jgi:2-polyprenyl-3-methyl-5-hydroxy-6-metoxy-1,4-benzoquinol methylase